MFHLKNVRFLLEKGEIVIQENGYEIRMIDLFDTVISRGGYDPLCKVLDLELREIGVYRFFEVPEDVWYELRKSFEPCEYLRKHVSGRFEVEKRLDNSTV